MAAKKEVVEVVEAVVGVVEKDKVNKDGLPIDVPLTEEQIAEGKRKQAERNK